MLHPDGPDEIFGDLFEQVQSQRVFSDSKTFVDCTPKADVTSILDAFGKLEARDPETLRRFVLDHFLLPVERDVAVALKELPPVRDRIEQLWDILSRAADRVDPKSSLIALPRPYIVPGGRFREIYYWDSYFTMLGLAESGRHDVIRDMVENFAYLIDRIGFVPNGNRTYFCTRSQPPFFVLMVELLAEVTADPGVLQKYLPQLDAEYDFWMDGTESLAAEGDATRRVVSIGGGFLNRYWDDSDRPRQESHAEDLEHGANADRDKRDYYRNIRAACESGWDFSSRWLDESDELESIRTTTILPVDLNCLLYRLETRLAEAHAGSDERRAERLVSRAEFRKSMLQTLFFDAAAGYFVDVDIATRAPTGKLSLAAAFPLFLEIAAPPQAERVVERLQTDFLATGGWLTTTRRTGQQWDRPNGWAPLQWVVFQGLSNYGRVAEAEVGASRWVTDNIAVYEATGRLLEKYDVERVRSLAAGGEYEVQDGFGWTNGVLLALMNRLGL